MSFFLLIKILTLNRSNLRFVQSEIEKDIELDSNIKIKSKIKARKKSYENKKRKRKI